jgi:hypothetical protein
MVAQIIQHQAADPVSARGNLPRDSSGYFRSSHRLEALLGAKEHVLTLIHKQ